MKNLYFKIAALFFLLGIVSCDSQLDLAPTDILIEEEVFANVETAEMALADIYHKLFIGTNSCNC